MHFNKKLELESQNYAKKLWTVIYFKRTIMHKAKSRALVNLLRVANQQYDPGS